MKYFNNINKLRSIDFSYGGIRTAYFPVRATISRPGNFIFDRLKREVIEQSTVNTGTLRLHV